VLKQLKARPLWRTQVDSTWRAPSACLFLSALVFTSALLLSGCRPNLAGSSSGKGYPDRVLGPMAYSPNGNLLAVGYYGSSGGEVEVWDTRNPNKPTAVLPAHGEEVESLAFSGDSKLLAYGGSRGDGVVRVVDTTNLKGSPVELRGHASDVRSIAMSPDGHTLATVDLNNTLKIWDISNLQSAALTKTVQRGGLTNMLAISPDGQTMAIASLLSTEVELRKVSDPGGSATILHGTLNPESPPVFSPDGRYLAIGASTANLPGTPVASLTSAMLTSAVELWDLSAPGTAPWLLTGNVSMSVGGVAFSPDGKWLADAKIDAGLVEVWDMSSVSSEQHPVATAIEWKGAPARVFRHDAAYSVAFSPDGKTLASGSMHTSIKLWEYLQASAVPTVLADPSPSQP